MHFFEWKNKNVGDFDIFAVLCKSETNALVYYYNTKQAEGVSFSDDDKYFYFLNKEKKIITPMPNLSLAFGGQYNDCAPYGDEIANFSFNMEEYSLVL